MAALISQLVSIPGKKLQNLVTPLQFVLQKTNFKQHESIAYSIVHAIPGRLRLRVPRIAQDAKYLERLERLLKADIWVKSERSNSAAASIVVTYEPNAIALKQMRSHLIELIQFASGVEIATELSTSYGESSPRVKSSALLACSLAVRQVKVAAESCGLFKSRVRKPLKGGALAARINRLHRIGIMI